MALIQLTEEYNSLGGVGGTCALCNASKRFTDRPEKVITTNLVTNMLDAPDGVWPEQWMEFCETCVTEMGHLVGMKSQDEADALIRQIDQLIDQRDGLQEYISQLESEIKAFMTLQKYSTVDSPMERDEGSAGNITPVESPRPHRGRR